MTGDNRDTACLLSFLELYPHKRPSYKKWRLFPDLHLTQLNKPTTQLMNEKNYTWPTYGYYVAKILFAPEKYHDRKIL